MQDSKRRRAQSQYLYQFPTCRNPECGGVLYPDEAEGGGICRDCQKELEQGREPRYSLKQIDALVKSIMNHMEKLRLDDTAMLDLFDGVEWPEAARVYPALKRFIGENIPPEEKALIIVRAAAFYWLKRDNRVEKVIMPLPFYPELSAPLDCVLLDIRREQKPVKRQKIDRAAIARAWLYHWAGVTVEALKDGA